MLLLAWTCYVVVDLRVCDASVVGVAGFVVGWFVVGLVRLVVVLVS